MYCKGLEYLVLDVVEEVGEGILLVVGHDVADGQHPVPEHPAHLIAEWSSPVSGPRSALIVTS